MGRLHPCHPLPPLPRLPRTILGATGDFTIRGREQGGGGLFMRTRARANCDSHQEVGDGFDHTPVRMDGGVHEKLHQVYLVVLVAEVAVVVVDQPRAHEADDGVVAELLREEGG